MDIFQKTLFLAAALAGAAFANASTVEIVSHPDDFTGWKNLNTNADDYLDHDNGSFRVSHTPDFLGHIIAREALYQIDLSELGDFDGEIVSATFHVYLESTQGEPNYDVRLQATAHNHSSSLPHDNMMAFTHMFGWGSYQGFPGPLIEAGDSVGQWYSRDVTAYLKDRYDDHQAFGDSWIYFRLRSAEDYTGPAAFVSGQGHYFFSHSGSADETTRPYLEITIAALDPQTITFDPLVERQFGDAPFDLVATASSGLPVSFSSSDPSVASIDGETVTIEGAGTAIITASQAGDDTWAAAPDVERTLLVEKAPASVTLSDLEQTYTGLPRKVTATTDPAGLEVTITYNGSTSAPTGAGDYTVSATIDDANYSGDATGTLAVARASQTIVDFEPIPTLELDSVPHELNAGATSGLEVEFTIDNPSIADFVRPGILEPLQPGTAEVTARQPGDDNWLPAPEVTRTVVVLAPLPEIFVQWIEKHRDLPAAESGPFDDPDGDGFPNIMEFAFGGHPLEPGSADAPTFKFDSDGQLRMEVTKNPDADEVIDFRVEWTDDPASGDWIDQVDEPYLIETIEDDRDKLIVRSRLSMQDYPRQFMRARVFFLEED